MEPESTLPCSSPKSTFRPYPNPMNFRPHILYSKSVLLFTYHLFIDPPCCNFSLRLEAARYLIVPYFFTLIILHEEYNLWFHFSLFSSCPLIYSSLDPRIFKPCSHIPSSIFFPSDKICITPEGKRCNYRFLIFSVKCVDVNNSGLLNSKLRLWNDFV